MKILIIFNTILFVNFLRMFYLYRKARKEVDNISSFLTGRFNSLYDLTVDISHQQKVDNKKPKNTEYDKTESGTPLRIETITYPYKDLQASAIIDDYDLRRVGKEEVERQLCNQISAQIGDFITYTDDYNLMSHSHMFYAKLDVIDRRI